MSNTQDQPPVKPAITAKAAQRANAPMRGLIIALLISIGVFIPLYLLNPAKKASVYERDINVAAIAAQAEDVAGFPPLAPGLPDGWTSNYARWTAGSNDGVPRWEVGFLTPSREYIGLVQTKTANPTWLSQATEQAPVTGDRTMGGQSWQLRDKGGEDRSAILEYKGYTIVLTGTAPFDEFDVLAGTIVQDLNAAK